MLQSDLIENIYQQAPHVKAEQQGPCRLSSQETPRLQACVCVCTWYET